MAVLFYSIGSSIDGYICDRDGGFDWGAPSDEQFAEHTAIVRRVGVQLMGRRLYETMLVWETDPAIRSTPLMAEFAEVWGAVPKVVLSRTLDRVEGNARLATGTLAEEVASALAAADERGLDVEIGGADVAGQAIELGLVDELSIFRYPVLVGGGTPLLPPVTTQQDFELVESRTFDSRVVHERYVRTHWSSASHDGPAGT
jgi:dihydrofolate reductase